MTRLDYLRFAFTTEELAKFMHQNYRAAFVALHGRGSFMGVGHVGKGECRNEHDHSWESCHKKQYFLNRATRILVAKGNF